MPKTNEQIDAAITACALMVKGIFLTKPRDEWTTLIEGRIRYLLSQSEVPAVPAQSCGDAEQAEEAVTADAAWEAYLNEQKLILGMPGLMAKPSFIAGYMSRAKDSK